VRERGRGQPINDSVVGKSAHRFLSFFLGFRRPNPEADGEHPIGGILFVEISLLEMISNSALNLRDNVDYWKTKRKIKNDLQCN